MKFFSFSVVFSVVVILNSFNALAQTQTKQVAALSQSKADNAAKVNEPAIQWLTIQEAIEKNKKKPKKIFIDVYTDWCGWCKVMDKQTFSDPFIIEYMNANYYAVKLNAEKDEKVSFKGKEYGFVAQGTRGYHELAAELMNGKLSYPTVVFLDEKMDLLQPIPGFRKPSELDVILKYFGGDHYKNTNYDVFQQKYQSPYINE
jgi:thioredoxin-related protein